LTKRAAISLIFCLTVAACGFNIGCSGTPPSFNSVVLTPSASVTIGEGGILSIAAKVLNDSSGAGVTWTLNPATGSLTGSTTANTTYNAPANVTTATTVTVKATSVTYPSRSASLQIAIEPAPTIVTTSLPSGSVNGAYNGVVTATGGVPPFTWSVASGSLPAGLTLGASTTNTVPIVGTPTTAGLSAPFTIKVTDSTGASATSPSFTINVGNLAIVTTSPLPSASRAAAYNFQFQASGGTTPYSWSVASGFTLPAGLTLSSTGVLAGTPTTQNTYTFGVTVTDSEAPPASVTQTFSLTVGGATGVALLSGNYAFEFSGFNSSGAVVLAGSFQADGAGNIKSGVDDFNSVAGHKSEAFTGTYTIGGDNRGQLIFTITGTSTTRTYDFAMDALGADARMIEFDSSGIRGSGEIELQNVSACSASTIPGSGTVGESYVFGLTGSAANVSGITPGPVNLAGQFTAQAPTVPGQPGSLSGEADVNIPGITVVYNPNNAPVLSGTFQTSANSGFCTMNLLPQQTSSAMNFSVYPVSGSAAGLTEAFIVETDTVASATPYLTVGKMAQQCILVSGACAASPFSGQAPGTFFTAASVAALTGQFFNSTTYVPDVAIAELVGTAGNSFTMSVVENQAGTIATYSSPFQATFNALDPDGRASTNLALPFAPVLYIISQNEALCIGQINDNPFLGTFEPQSMGGSSSFSASTVAGALIEGTSVPATNLVPNLSGVVTLTEATTTTGTVAGTQDVSTTATNTAGVAVTGTYALSATGSSDGSGTFTLTTPAPFTASFFIVSPTKMVMVSTTTGDVNPVLLILGH
jgi:large repetitive protein